MDDARFTLRAAGRDDAGFLADMLVEAVNWLPGRELCRERILADPDLAHYVSGWQCSCDVGGGGGAGVGDLGVVAVAPGGQPVGAAWLRTFTADDPGYGFVAPDVPELSMGVHPSWRGRGVGRALLRETVRTAAAAGGHRISLSVERANHAARLYTSEGFSVVRSGPDSDTMVRVLTPPRLTPPRLAPPRLAPPGFSAPR